MILVTGPRNALYLRTKTSIMTEQQFSNHARLRMGQIVALRFAPDDEFVALADKAATEGLSPKEIKQPIQRWKGDYRRI